MKYTNLHGLPKSLHDALVKNTYDISQVSNVLSVTTLIDSPKAALLKKRHWNELEEDISDSVWLLLGSAVHSVLERISDENRLIEERIYVDTETWELVDKNDLKPDRKYIAGKSDLYEYLLKTIQDYKITSVWSVIYGKKEWEYQLNCYSWFYRKLGFEVDKLQIIAILKDWSKKEFLNSYGGNYPEIPVAVIDVPIWTFEQQEKYIKERYVEHQKYQDVKDDDIPECNPDQRWKKAGDFAVYKNDNKKATKVFETAKEAQAFAASLNTGKDVYKAVERPGSDRRCLDYCSACEFCHYWRKNYGSQNK